MKPDKEAAPEWVEAAAKIIDPVAWQERERLLERKAEWEKRPALAAVDFVAIYARDADRIIEPSIDRAKAVAALPNAGERIAALEAIRWLAGEPLMAEIMNGADGAWAKQTPEERIKGMGERRKARDAAILSARTALAGEQG